jgi:hypothetical protein
MGVAKAGGDTAVKEKAALVANGAFRHHVDLGSRGKVGSNGRVAVDNRQQWQLQSGNNQLKVTVVSDGVESHGGSGEQRQSAVIGSKTPIAKASIVMPPTSLSLLSAGGARRAAVVAARE